MTSNINRVMSEVRREVPPAQAMSLISETACLMRHATNGIKQCIAKRSSELLGNFRLAAMIGLPLTIGNTVGAAQELSPNSGMDRVDAALAVTAGVGAIGDSTVTSAEGLHRLGAISGNIGVWAVPLAFISCGLTFAGIILSAKNYAEILRFSRRLEEAAKPSKPLDQYTIQDYRNGIALLRDKMKVKNFAEKHLDINGEKLMKRLQEIESEANTQIESNDQEQAAKGKAKLHSTMQALRNRIKAKNWSNALNLLINTILFIGTAILLFNPIAPIGLLLIAIGAGAALSNFIYNKIMKRRLEQALGIQ